MQNEFKRNIIERSTVKSLIACLFFLSNVIFKKHAQGRRVFIERVFSLRALRVILPLSAFSKSSVIT